MNAQQQDVRGVIKQTGLKHTQTREQVLEQLTESDAPLSIDDLFLRLNGDINRVTLYRVVSDFVKVGIVYQTDFQTGKAYFEYQNQHHHHVICTECGRTQVVKACVSLPQQIPHFGSITRHSLEFFGVCDSCS